MAVRAPLVIDRRAKPADRGDGDVLKYAVGVSQRKGHRHDVAQLDGLGRRGLRRDGGAGGPDGDARECHHIALLAGYMASERLFAV